MKQNDNTIFCAAFILLFSVFLMASGADITGNNEPITIKLKDAGVRDVLTTMSTVVDVELKIDSCVKGTITLDLENVPFDTFLQSVLDIVDLTWEWQGDLLFIDCKIPALQPITKTELIGDGSVDVQVKVEEIQESGKVQILLDKTVQLRPGKRITINSSDFAPAGKNHLLPTVNPGGEVVKHLYNAFRLHLSSLIRDKERVTVFAVYSATRDTGNPGEYSTIQGFKKIDPDIPGKEVVLGPIPYTQSSEVKVWITIP